MNRTILSALAPAVLCIAAVLLGCDMFNKNKSQKMQKDMGKTAVANINPAGAAATQPANKNVTGTVTFTQAGNDVVVVAHLMGLSPGKHGIHIHAKSDLSDPTLQGAGPHYNPTNQKHGGPETPEHHAGDLGNITADGSGQAKLDMRLKNVSLDSLVGKSVIVHAMGDDLKSDPAGNSGGRIAGGVIETR